MRLKFPAHKQTVVRFFANEPALWKALGARQSLLLRDPNAPVHAPGLASFPLPAGEDCKRWSILEGTLLWLANQRAERSHTLVAVGGGAALDLSAFAASLYRRGMPLVLVPTTLLAMVDATLGGKTAVDWEDAHGLRKNFAGTFYPADEVWIYPGFLKTLPPRERISGAGECWKTVWLAGRAAPEKALEEFVRTGAVTTKLLALIKLSLETKRRFVERDPLDNKRIRESLNYGHTVGHALESLAKGRLSHGECVLWGMAVECGVLGAKGKKMQERVMKVIQSFGLALPEEFQLREDSWQPLMANDKKAKGGKLELTVLSAPGKPVKKQMTAAGLAKLVREFPARVRP